MNTKINDGGPAFPLQSIGPDFPPGHVGMTLRDWFAGHALPSIIMASQGVNHVTRNDVVGEAYLVADAMLAARLAEQEGNANA
jgi:hypothetical protein